MHKVPLVSPPSASLRSCKLVVMGWDFGQGVATSLAFLFATQRRHACFAVTLASLSPATMRAVIRAVEECGRCRRTACNCCNNDRLPHEIEKCIANCDPQMTCEIEICNFGHIPKSCACHSNPSPPLHRNRLSKTVSSRPPGNMPQVTVCGAIIRGIARSFSVHGDRDDTQDRAR